MKEIRKLALRREMLTELTTDELRGAIGAGLAPTLKDACGNTADSWCTIRFTFDCV